MRNKSMSDCSVVVKNFADATGWISVEKSERKHEKFLDCESADVAFDAERDQVRTDECRKVKENACRRENNGDYRIMLDHIV